MRKPALPELIVVSVAALWLAWFPACSKDNTSQGNSTGGGGTGASAGSGGTGGSIMNGSGACTDQWGVGGGFDGSAPQACHDYCDKAAQAGCADFKMDPCLAHCKDYLTLNVPPSCVPLAQAKYECVVSQGSFSCDSCGVVAGGCVCEEAALEHCWGNNTGGSGGGGFEFDGSAPALCNDYCAKAALANCSSFVLDECLQTCAKSLGDTGPPDCTYRSKAVYECRLAGAFSCDECGMLVTAPCACEQQGVATCKAGGTGGAGCGVAGAAGSAGSP